MLNLPRKRRREGGQQAVRKIYFYWDSLWGKFTPLDLPRIWCWCVTLFSFHCVCLPLSFPSPLLVSRQTHVVAVY